VILWSTWGLLKESVTMALPACLADRCRQGRETLNADSPGVTRVHDLHIWPMSTTEAR
jgi:cobalt-zinc-cadmium efflux system protein